MSAPDGLRFFINRHGPRWFRNRVGKSVAYRILATFAAMFDALTEWALQGAQARLPGVGTPTALGAIGKDRGYRRGFAQDNAIFAGRLPGWIEASKRIGHPFQILRELRGYLAPYSMRVRHVDNSGNWHTIEADGTETMLQVSGSWNWDNASAWWRGWVILYPPAELWPVWEAWDGSQWGGNYADDGETLGQDAPFAVAEDIREIVRHFKAQNVHVVNIIIAYVDSDFDPLNPTSLPDGTWGLPVDNSDPPNETRNPNARYWEGVI